MKSISISSRIALAACLLLPTARAIDIDIYTTGNPSATTIPPNVLFIFDNSANWESNSYTPTKKVIEHQALFQFADEIDIRNSDNDPINDVNINLAIMGATQNNSPGGGKPLYFFAPIRPDNVAPSSSVHVREIKGLLYCDRDHPNMTKTLYLDCITALTDPDRDGLVPDSNPGIYDSELTAAGLTKQYTPGEVWARWDDRVDDMGVKIDTGFGTWISSLSRKDQGTILEGKLPTANRAKYATQMHEAYLWFGGKRARAGKADGYLSYDFNAFKPTDQPEYLSPITAFVNNYLLDPSDEYCGKNHIVFMGNGGPDSGEDGQAQSLLSGLGGNTALITNLTPNNYVSNYADEYARFLANTDVNDDAAGEQNITTHTVDVYDPDIDKSSKPLLAAHALLESMANQGGGKYIVATEVDDIVEELLKLIYEIQAVNDVFAASALPVSVNVRGTNLNQVYIGVFRPDAGGRPNWLGNMKMYQLAYSAATDTLYLADADGAPASNSSTGFINSDARSFWTYDSVYWDTSQIKDRSYESSNDNADGDLVEKGAAAQHLRAAIEAGERKVLTLAGDAVVPFDVNAGSVTPAALGVATDAEKDKIVNWIRGNDVGNPDEEHTGSIARPSAHGDVLHSRPAVINYGDVDGDPLTEDEIYVFYGSNDGLFHAVRGGTEGTPEVLDAAGNVVQKEIKASGFEGDEAWSMVFPEHYSQLKTLYDNEMLTITDPLTGREKVDLSLKPFFVDGVIGAHIEDDGSKATRVIIYLTMRRGGDFIYALDVTDPKEPKVLWRKGKGDTGFDEMGQTWSAPKITDIKIDSDGDMATTDDVEPRRVLVMGLGYDANANDGKLPGEVTHTIGRGVIMLDYLTGEIVWQAGPSGTTTPTFMVKSNMNYSIPSDLTVIDRNRDGFADRIYFGDTGGQIFRMDIFDTDRTKWNIDRIFQPNGKKFKFLSAPTLAESTVNSSQDILVITSGDRENPFEETVENYIIVLKDANQGMVNSNITSRLIPSDPDNPVGEYLADGTVSADLVGNTAAQQRGWYIPLHPAEKGVSRAAIVNSTVYLNTYQPDVDGTYCSSLGVARNYQFDMDTGAAVKDTDADGTKEDSDRENVIDGGGFIPDPVSVIVEVAGEKREAIISGPRVDNPEENELNRRYQTFWMKDIDD